MVTQLIWPQALESRFAIPRCSKPYHPAIENVREFYKWHFSFKNSSSASEKKQNACHQGLMEGQGLKKKKKTSETLAKIAPEWRLPETELAKAAKQRDVTPAFFDQYLDAHELSIARQDATWIVKKLQTGELTARETTLVFGKAAAVAHQIVSRIISALAQ